MRLKNGGWNNSERLRIFVNGFKLKIKGKARYEYGNCITGYTGNSSGGR